MRYILALDDSKSTLKQITRAVSKNLGTGKFKQLAKEDALLNKEMSVSVQVQDETFQEIYLNNR